MRLHVGTSGFSYDEWRPAFYPPEVKKDAMLGYYAERLPSVELNNTFYRMPSAKVTAKWASEVPDGFAFAIKASQRITWTKQLADCEEPLGYLWKALEQLGPKLGCVFYQVPKWVRKDLPRLRGFLALQRAGVKVAFEFVHPSWHEDDTVQALREHDAALVLSDRDEAPSPELVDTGTWSYLRLRRAAYDDAALRAWHQRIANGVRRECFVFFKHEDSCAGPALAQRFLALRKDA